MFKRIKEKNNSTIYVQFEDNGKLYNENQALYDYTLIPKFIAQGIQFKSTDSLDITVTQDGVVYSYFTFFPISEFEVLQGDIEPVPSLIENETAFYLFIERLNNNETNILSKIDQVSKESIMFKSREDLVKFIKFAKSNYNRRNVNTILDLEHNINAYCSEDILFSLDELTILKDYSIVERERINDNIQLISDYCNIWNSVTDINDMDKVKPFDYNYIVKEIETYGIPLIKSTNLSKSERTSFEKLDPIINFMVINTQGDAYTHNGVTRWRAKDSNIYSNSEDATVLVNTNEVISKFNVSPYVFYSTMDDISGKTITRFEVTDNINRINLEIIPSSFKGFKLAFSNKDEQKILVSEYGTVNIPNITTSSLGYISNKKEYAYYITMYNRIRNLFLDNEIKGMKSNYDFYCTIMNEYSALETAYFDYVQEVLNEKQEMDKTDKAKKQSNQDKEELVEGLEGEEDNLPICSLYPNISPFVLLVQIIDAKDKVHAELQTLFLKHLDVEDLSLSQIVEVLNNINDISELLEDEDDTLSEEAYNLGNVYMKLIKLILQVKQDGSYYGALGRELNSIRDINNLAFSKFLMSKAKGTIESCSTFNEVYNLVDNDLYNSNINIFNSMRTKEVSQSIYNREKAKLLEYQDSLAYYYVCGVYKSPSLSKVPFGYEVIDLYDCYRWITGINKMDIRTEDRQVFAETIFYFLQGYHHYLTITKDNGKYIIRNNKANYTIEISQGVLLDIMSSKYLKRYATHEDMILYQHNPRYTQPDKLSPSSSVLFVDIKYFLANAHITLDGIEFNQLTFEPITITEDNIEGYTFTTNEGEGGDVHMVVRRGIESPYLSVIEGNWTQDTYHTQLVTIDKAKYMYNQFIQNNPNDPLPYRRGFSTLITNTTLQDRYRSDYINNYRSLEPISAMATGFVEDNRSAYSLDDIRPETLKLEMYNKSLRDNETLIQYINNSANITEPLPYVLPYNHKYYEKQETVQFTLYRLLACDRKNVSRMRETWATELSAIINDKEIVPTNLYTYEELYKVRPLSKEYKLDEVDTIDNNKVKKDLSNITLPDDEEMIQAALNINNDFSRYCNKFYVVIENILILIKENKRYTIGNESDKEELKRLGIIRTVKGEEVIVNKDRLIYVY